MSDVRITVILENAPEWSRAHNTLRWRKQQKASFRRIGGARQQPLGAANELGSAVERETGTRKDGGGVVGAAELP